MRKIGIKVEFNGDHYVLEFGGEGRKYAVGEMACELSRLRIIDLKEAVVRNQNFHAQAERESMEKSVAEIREEYRKVFSPVISELAAVGLINYVRDYFSNDDEEWRKDWMLSLDDLCNRGDVKEELFADTDFQDIGAECEGQLFLSILLVLAWEFKIAMSTFQAFVESADNKTGQKKAYSVFHMSKRDSFLQDIGYSLQYYNNRFNSVYVIRDMMSLLLFEMAHVYDRSIPIGRCKNCGQYFVPQKRSDTKYCNYPAPDNPEKTCKEIGAQNTWASKERTDDVTQAYRKVYMRYKMRANRHPDDAEAQEKMEQLSEGIREWRQKMSSGEAEKEEFIRWLEGFEERGTGK